MNENIRKGSPGRTLMGFVAVVAILTVFVIRDALNREADEEWYYPTALGDEAMFAAPATITPGEAIAVALDGAPLVVVTPELLHWRDWAMEKVGRDDSDRYFIYRAVPSGYPNDPEADPEALFLKVTQGEGTQSDYLEVARSAETGAS